MNEMINQSNQSNIDQSINQSGNRGTLSINRSIDHSITQSIQLFNTPFVTFEQAWDHAF